MGDWATFDNAAALVPVMFGLVAVLTVYQRVMALIDGGDGLPPADDAVPGAAGRRARVNELDGMRRPNTLGGRRG